MYRRKGAPGPRKGFHAPATVVLQISLLSTRQRGHRVRVKEGSHEHIRFVAQVPPGPSQSRVSQETGKAFAQGREERRRQSDRPFAKWAHRPVIDRSNDSWILADAQRAVAREYGFASWPRFRAHVDSLQPVAQPAAHSLSDAEWDALIDRAEETGAIAFDARELATDSVLRKLARLRRLRRLTLWRSPITDDGLRHLVGLTELTQLDLGQCPGLTDAGLAVLRELPNLTHFGIEHQKAITDRGLHNLAGLRHLPPWARHRSRSNRYSRALPTGWCRGLRTEPAVKTPTIL